MKMLDCTLRDGGYYNAWDFPRPLIVDYLAAMEAAQVDYIELGFRSFDASSFRGACAYTTDDFLRTLSLPQNARIGVMVNAAELIAHAKGPAQAITLLFSPAQDSPVSLVRLACQMHELEPMLPVCAWLKTQGYSVGINLMQIADRSEGEIEQAARLASKANPDVLYFADSMGSLNPEQTSWIVSLLRRGWGGALGIHTHDNMGHALANSLRAVEEGVDWVDSTVTGMGRGPGNSKTEYMVIERDRARPGKANITPLLRLIRQHFQPMQAQYGWGSNVYYYLAGHYGIHPTYIQRMLSDSRYSDADILSVIEHLKSVGGKKFKYSNLEAGRSFFGEPASGNWSPRSAMEGREVLIVAPGPGLVNHREAVETYIRRKKPYVMALNTGQVLAEELVDSRVACHPVRLLADCEHYTSLPQPLICPASMLPADVRDGLAGHELLDFGLRIEEDRFAFDDTHCTVPTSLVVAYALAVATSGHASHITLAGFDGYGADDPRNAEMNALIASYTAAAGSKPIHAITPTRFIINTSSVYAL